MESKKEIEVLMERIKYLEGIIQDNVKDINPDDIKEWSEEEVIHTIEDKDRIILHLKERIKEIQKGITVDPWYDQGGIYDRSDIEEMREWDVILMDGLDRLDEDEKDHTAVRSID